MKYYIIHVFQTNTIHFFFRRKCFTKDDPCFLYLSQLYFCIQLLSDHIIHLIQTFPVKSRKKRVSGKMRKQMAILTQEV